MAFQPLYHRLESRRFRLLLLDEGESNDFLKGELYEYSLDRPPLYEALSYVWKQRLSWGKGANEAGDTSRRGKFETFSGRHRDGQYVIFIGGYEFPLTQNLAAALWSFRCTSKQKLLWVDQVCINQDDVDDKNQQVRLMGCIYGAAERVLVWLGEEFPSTKSIFETIRSFKIPTMVPVAGYSTSQPVHSELALFQNQAKLLEPWFYDQLGELCLLPWFRRVWVFQEVCLNPKSSVFCGSCSLPLAILSQFLFHLFQHVYSSRIRNINVRGLFDAAAFGRFAALQDRSGQDDLMSLIIKTEACFASDPRDKVFAFASLLNKRYVELGFEPDYRRSTAEAFTHATSVHLSASGNLDILERAQPRQELEDCQLPSWVPNFVTNPERDSKVFLPYKYSRAWPFAASLGAKAFLTFPTPTTLSVTGHIIDEVVQVLDPVPCFPDFKIHEDATKVYSSWRSQVETMKSLTSYPYGGGTIEHAYWHTITTDIHDQKIRNSFHECPEVTQKRADTLPELSEAMRVNIRSVTEGRRLVVTRAGALVLSPAKTLVGDIVSILSGGRMPFILRPRKISGMTSLFGKNGVFALVGECFVHGVMYGDFYKGVEDMRVPETFVIV